MKALYMARVYRWDLLWTTNWLVRHMTKWSQVRDMKLKRRIAYVKPTEKFAMQSYINDPIHRCNVALLSDADLAGDVATSKSATGGYVALVRRNT